MDTVQTASAFFFLPVTTAYLAVCAFFFLVKNRLWTPQVTMPSGRKWLDLALAFVACAGVIAIGQLYAKGWLLPAARNRWGAAALWTLNNCIIYSPIPLTLLVRRQGLETIYCSFWQFWQKAGFGLLATALGISTFVLLRGEWSRLPEVLAASLKLSSLQYFPAVFLEGVAVAFLFVRLQWTLGKTAAIAIPALLFAFAHVPGMVEEGKSLFHILSFSAVTGGITAFMLWTLAASRDIIWLGIVHYGMDVVIKAF